MKFFTTIISTTFSSEINTDKDVMEIAEVVVQTYAYKIKKRTNNKVVFVPYWLSFLFTHPNAFITRSSFVMNKEKNRIEFKIWHPFHVVLATLTFLLFDSGDSPFLFLIPIIYLSYLLTYSIINQNAIFKKIVREIEK